MGWRANRYGPSVASLRAAGSMLNERRRYQIGQNATIDPNSQTTAPALTNHGTVDMATRLGAHRCAVQRNTGSRNVAPYAAARGPKPRSERRARPRIRKVTATTSSYIMGGSSIRPALPDVSGSVNANAAKNAHPTQSDNERIGLTAGDFAEVASIISLVAEPYWTSAIDPVIGLGFVLKLPVDAIEVKYPAICAVPA